jgi:hypothetical protein
MDRWLSNARAGMIATRKDLDELIANKVPEGKNLEYKRDLPGQEDGFKILRSITSLANTTGGHLLYGVEAADGIPVALPGVETPTPDAIRLRIENLCRDGVQDRLPQLDFDFIPVDGGNSVLVVRVPKSWAAPHRVTVGKYGHFFARKTGSYPMDVSELRAAFSLSHGLADRAREFRTARLQSILAGETPVPVSSAGKLVLHVIAASAFDSATGAGVVPSPAQRHRFAPVGWGHYSSHLNFDGYVSYASPAKPNVAYTQHFRSGIVEAMLAFERHSDGHFYLVPQWYEILLINWTKEYLSALAELGSPSPYFLFLSFLGISQFQLTADIGSVHAQRKLDRDNLILPSVVVEGPRDLNVAMRALFDMVWNAFGLERSAFFNERSDWIGPAV